MSTNPNQREVSPLYFVLWITTIRILGISSVEELWEDYSTMTLLAILIVDTSIRIINNYTLRELPVDPLSTTAFCLLGLAFLIIWCFSFYQSMLEFLVFKHQSIFHWLINLVVVVARSVTLRIVQIDFVSGSLFIS